MLEDIRRSPLFKIANPKSLAVFGASADTGMQNRGGPNMGTIQLQSLLDLGFEGNVYPIHPRDKEVLGLRAYKDVRELPEVPDLALIVVPTRAVVDVIKACGEKGIRSAIVISAGFKEMGDEGKGLEQELMDTARTYNIRFLGPNCIGVTNPHSKLNTTVFKYIARPGTLGMASQSGSFVTQMFEYLNLYAMGFSTAFSVGNEADIDMVDCLEYLGACPNTKVIALYIEGIKRGRDFVRVAREVSFKKPIIAYYAGGTKTGSRAGKGHTGAVAGPEALYHAAFRQAGVIKADTITELFQMAWGFGCLPIPNGNKVVVLTHSGGPGASASDAAGRAGLIMEDLSPSLVQRLKEYLPGTANFKNPVDLTFTRNLVAYYNDIPEIILSDQDTDIVFMYTLLPQERLRSLLMNMGVREQDVEGLSREAMDTQASFLRDLMDEKGKPLLCFNFRDTSDPYVKTLIRHGVPVFADPHLAAKVMGAMVGYGRWIKRQKEICNRGGKDEEC